MMMMMIMITNTKCGGIKNRYYLKRYRTLRKRYDGA